MPYSQDTKKQQLRLSGWQNSDYFKFMSEKTIYTVFESAFELDIAAFCHVDTVRQVNFSSNRKLIAAVKTSEPDFIMAEFIYSPSLGTQISSLDGILGTVERFCQKTQLIIYTNNKVTNYIYIFEDNSIRNLISRNPQSN